MTVGYYAIQTWMFEQLTKVFSILLTPSLRKFSSAFPLSNLQRGMDPSLHSKFNQIHFLQLIDLIYCSFPSQFAGGERVWAEKSSVNNGSINRRNNWRNFFFFLSLLLGTAISVLTRPIWYTWEIKWSSLVQWKCFLHQIVPLASVIVAPSPESYKQLISTTGRILSSMPL